LWRGAGRAPRFAVLAPPFRAAAFPFAFVLVAI
jgi:hypothetical protein